MAIYKVLFEKLYTILTLLTGGGGGWSGAKRAPLPKICLTYPTMISLGIVLSYPKKIQKIYKSRYTHLSSAVISIFSLKISKFCYTKKYRYRLR